MEANGRSMISVNVRYYNLLRRRAGVGHATLRLPVGANLQTALQQMVSLHGRDLQEALLSPEDDVVSHLVVFCNDKLVHEDRAEFSLADGDELKLFPASSGG